MADPWKKRLPELWAAQNGCCHFCGRYTLMVRDAQHLPGVVFRNHGLWWEGKRYLVATVEHLTPRSEGGSRKAWSNLVMACSACNHRRNDARQRSKAKADRKRNEARGDAA